MTLRVTDEKYFSKYYNQIGKNIDRLIASYDFTGSSGNFQNSMQSSAVFSSNIEGNTVDLNSFMNYKLSGRKPDKEIQEIENLVSAYEFANNNRLTEKNFLQSHKLLSNTLVSKGLRGKYRDQKVGVFNGSGLVYLAIEPENLSQVMKELFQDIAALIEKDLDSARVFYHASLIHLKIAHIHPFADGNGRAARLLEKWFIAEKLGKNFWKIQSEQFYKEHRPEYYKNINLGVNYCELDYNKCIPFLEMLVKSLEG